MVTGCATFSESTIPDVPADLRKCFDTLVGAPAGEGALTAGQMVTLIGALDRKQVEQSACGKRLLAWIDGLRGGAK